ncbi:hypothetical protein DFH06DRAFT_1423071 [Mycena polygramma]|nr:hypothetical protein DFH06DRAFT_1423071 [Mycena polygramma]
METRRRTLRNGKEFSEFDLLNLSLPSTLSSILTAPPISSPEFFDVSISLATHISEQESTGLLDEPAELQDTTSQLDDAVVPLDLPPDLRHTLPFWINPSLPASVPFPQPPPLHPPAKRSAEDHTMDLKKAASRRRRDRKRDAVMEASHAPHLKTVHVRRQQESLANTIQVDVDLGELPHSNPAWIGSRAAQTAEEDGMGGRLYTAEEISALVGGQEGFRYINWLGFLSIPIIDSFGRIIAVLGGTPRDRAGWADLTEEASTLMKNRSENLSYSEEDLHHRRAQEPYPSVSRGVSHGGGQKEPGNLQNNTANTRVTDELMKEPVFQRLSKWANLLFIIFAPLLATYYQAQIGLLADWKPSLVWNFAGTVFAACTFNFGPRAITVPHLDFGNLSWGWCVITALGWFDPDLGGHLILWDLKLIIRFPPGSTILIPSAIIRHSNVPVRSHEIRFSFTQYTAGGLFRWIRNGFKTDEDFAATATWEEKRERAAESKTRWEKGVAMYSTVSTLKK